MGALDEQCIANACKDIVVCSGGLQQQNEMHREGPGPTISGPAGDTPPGGTIRCWQSCKQTACAPSSKMQKVLCAVFWIATIIAGAVLFVVIFPRFVDGVVTPFMNLLKGKLTPVQIGAVIFAAMVILPFTLVITVIPFVWMSGIIFTFPLALAIVMAGSAVGMALQYLLARYIFHDKVEKFINDNPRRHGLTVTLRAVELAGPWKVVALLRLGPFPYHLLNYALGVCPSIKFHVYILCSVVCEVLPRSLQVFFGRSLDTLADLFRGRVSNVGLAIYNIVVLLIGILFVGLSITIARRLLKRLEEQELQKEAAEAAGAADAEAQLGQDGPLAEADSTVADGQSPAVGFEGDLDVLVEDGSGRGEPAKVRMQQSISRLSSSSSSSTLIPAGFLPRAASAGFKSCSSPAV